MRTASVATVSNVEAAFDRFWHPVARASELGDLPLHVELLGRHYVVVALDGGLRAFEDSCPHRSFPLSHGDLVEGTLRCPYHGYRFDGEGRCVFIPALPPGLAVPPKAGLRPAGGVATHLDWVWLAPDEPCQPLPELPEFFEDRFGKVVLGPYTWNAGAAQMTDNFLDVSHFPFVHAGTFGIESDAVIPSFSVDRQGLNFSYSYHHEFRNGAEASALQGVHSPSQHRRIRSSFFPPFGTVFRVDYEESGVVTVVFSVSQPVSARTSRLWTILLSTDIDADTEESARTFEEKILFEDQSILEKYREPEMVLDLEAQFHTHADRMTVEFRRVLAEILFGVPGGKRGAQP